MKLEETGGAGESRGCSSACPSGLRRPRTHSSPRRRELAASRLRTPWPFGARSGMMDGAPSASPVSTALCCLREGTGDAAGGGQWPREGGSGMGARPPHGALPSHTPRGAVPWGPLSPSAARGGVPGPHTMHLLPPLNQHLTPPPPGLSPEVPCRCSPGVPFPLHNVSPPSCACRSALAPPSSSLNYTVSNSVRTPALGKGPLPSASFPGLPYPTVLFRHYPFSRFMKPNPPISPPGLAAGVAGTRVQARPSRARHGEGLTKGSRPLAEIITRNARREVPFAVTLLR